MKDIIVLDCYIKVLGCTSQLCVIMNCIHTAHTMNTDIYIHQFNKDIFHRNSIPFNSLIKIDQTNENLRAHNYNTQLLENDPRDNNDTTIIKVIIHKDIKPNNLLFPVRDMNIFQCFVFNDDIMNKVKISIPQSPYYSIHLRIEVDAILYFIGNMINDKIDNYTSIEDSELQYMKVNEFIHSPVVSAYIRYLIHQYKKNIDIIGKHNTFFICTAINKSKINAGLRYVLNEIVDYIGKDNVIIGEIHYPDCRELNSLIELIVMIQSNGNILSNRSLFSNMACKINNHQHYMVQYNKDIHTLL